MTACTLHASLISALQAYYAKRARSVHRICRGLILYIITRAIKTTGTIRGVKVPLGVPSEEQDSNSPGSIPRNIEGLRC